MALSNQVLPVLSFLKSRSESSSFATLVHVVPCLPEGTPISQGKMVDKFQAYLHSSMKIEIKFCSNCRKIPLENRLPIQELRDQYTLMADTLLLDCFPSSICTEILARDRSTPEFWSACVRVLNNLFNTKDAFIILIHNQHAVTKYGSQIGFNL